MIDGVMAELEAVNKASGAPPDLSSVPDSLADKLRRDGFPAPGVKRFYNRNFKPPEKRRAG